MTKKSTKKKSANPKPIRTVIFTRKIQKDEIGFYNTDWENQRLHLFMCSEEFAENVVVPNTATQLDVNIYKEKPKSMAGVVPIEVIDWSQTYFGGYPLIKIDGKKSRLSDQIKKYLTKLRPKGKVECMLYAKIEWS